MSTVDRNLTGLHRRWGLSPSTLAPGCFASVMATGIVSIGAELAGWHLLSVGLLSQNKAFDIHCPGFLLASRQHPFARARAGSERRSSCQTSPVRFGP